MSGINYAGSFQPLLQQKYEAELKSVGLTKSNQDIKFVDAKTIKVPTMTLSGYKDHNRKSIGFNAGTADLDWTLYTLVHDRDIEFGIDPMDVDETNLALSIANVQNRFEEDQAIPEKDSYTFSKLYTEANKYKANGAVVDETPLTKSNILSIFDDLMEKMDDASVPAEGRILYVTAATKKLLKQAEELQRYLNISSGAQAVNRNIHSLDDVELVTVPKSRMMTAYDFTDGCKPGLGAKQINMILAQPKSVISRDKYAYIRIFTPGTDSRTADKYIYQNRYYTDTFIIPQKAAGVAMNVTSV